MEEVVRQVGLAFELNGEFLEERVVISGVDLASVLGEAEVFGRHAEFGREFLGLSGWLATLEDLFDDEVEAMNTLQQHSSPQVMTAEAREKWLAELGVDEVAAIEEFESFDALSDEFYEIEWWHKDAAFGIATPVAVDLQRCCAADAAFAGAAAFSVLDALHHQGTVYPVAATALPFIVDLLSDERVLCRRVLASGLFQLAHSVAEVPEGNAVRNTFERLGSEVMKVATDRDALLEAMQRHVDSSRAFRRAFEAQRQRLEPLAGLTKLGPGIAKSMQLL